MSNIREKHTFTYDENGLCEVKDPSVLDVLSTGGRVIAGAGCKVNSGNCVAGCSCKSESSTQ